MGSNGIIDLIFHFHERSSGIIDPAVGSTSMSASHQDAATAMTIDCMTV